MYSRYIVVYILYNCNIIITVSCDTCACIVLHVYINKQPNLYADE